MRRIGSALGFWRFLRSLSPHGMASEANLPHDIAVVATSEGAGRCVIEAIGGTEAGEPQREDLTLAVLPSASTRFRPAEIAIWAIDRPLGNQTGQKQILARLIPDATVLVVVFPSRTGLLDWGSQLNGLPPHVRTELLPVADFDAEELRADLVPLLLHLAPDLRLALARHFPSFRAAVAHKIILETSTANARFAALSNLPALIPVVGNILAAGADLYVLTRNQVTMVYLLAAISGRDPRGGFRHLLEVFPLIGTGFFWRTVARELAALLPFYLGAVPKILVAFAGTYVLGQTAAAYFLHGRRPEPKVVDGYFRNAVEHAKTLMPRG